MTSTHCVRTAVTSTRKKDLKIINTEFVQHIAKELTGK